MQWFRAVINRLFHTGMDAFFPLRCCACDDFFRYKPFRENAGAGIVRSGDGVSFFSAFVCPRCMVQLRGIDSPMCIRCGRPFESPHGVDHECDTCRADAPQYTMARAFGRYEGPLRSLIHYFKYNGWPHLAKPLGQLLWNTLNRYWDPARIDHVVPVPLHHRRLRRRGFNQSALLVHNWPKYAAVSGIEWDPNRVAQPILTRHRGTAPQAGLNKWQRDKNIKQAFKLAGHVDITNKRILLVDDVLTTGATVNACARILMGGGACEVRVLTLAHAV